MRARAAGVVLGIIVSGAVGLTAVAVRGAAVDDLTSADLLGGPKTDPADEPISAGRWLEDTPTELAGGPPEPAAVPAPMQIAAASPAARASAALPPPSITQVAFRETRHPAARRARLEVTDGRAPDTRTLSNAFSIAQPPSEPDRFDAKRMLLRIGPAPQDRKQGRWFIFAAGSGEAFGLNMIKDPVRGWRRAGWSVERLAEYGKAQVGVGWRRGDSQLAFSVARREIAAYGVSREDTVVGVTYTVSGKPPAKTRFEQRLPRR